MTKVLLVNVKSGTASIRIWIPHGLLTLSTYYKNKGYEVKYAADGSFPRGFQPDIICFSTVFLFNLKKELSIAAAYRKKFPRAKIRIGGVSATMRPELFQKVIPSAEVYVGMDEELEYTAPDYYLTKTDFSYGFTTKGCVRKCPWCVVPKIEGGIIYKRKEGWVNQIGHHKLFSAMDNNILATTPDHLDDVMQEVQKRDKLVEFNQAMDCRIFAKKLDYAKVFSKYPGHMYNYIFAWDSKAQDKFIEPTVELMKEHNLKSKNGSTWYVLYGFKEKTEDIWNRMKVLSNNNQAFKLMHFIDIETGKYSDRPDQDDQLLKSWISDHFLSGIARVNKRNPTEAKWLGNSFEEWKLIARAMNIFCSQRNNMSVKSKNWGDIQNIMKSLQKQTANSTLTT